VHNAVQENVYNTLHRSELLSYLDNVKLLPERLKELQEELYQLSKQAQEGKIERTVAADRIMEIREEIDKIKLEAKK
jgi:hypothetical protein